MKTYNYRGYTITPSKYSTTISKDGKYVNRLDSASSAEYFIDTVLLDQ